MTITPEQVRLGALALGLTLLSGVADSQGFVHASRIWRDGRVNWPELTRSALGFGFGITLYWLSLKYLQEFGVFSAEVQVLVWLVVTLVGVAVASGSFFQWRPLDQVVTLGVFAGICWLLVRTGT